MFTVSYLYDIVIENNLWYYDKQTWVSSIENCDLLSILNNNLFIEIKDKRHRKYWDNNKENGK